MSVIWLRSGRWQPAVRAKAPVSGLCVIFAIAVIVAVTSIGPRLNVMTPPSASARGAVAGAQFAGVPVPTTRRALAGRRGAGALRPGMPAAGGGVAMDVNRYHALAVYILVLTGLRLVVAPPRQRWRASLIQSSDRRAL
jgi:hypothetical protein